MLFSTKFLLTALAAFPSMVSPALIPYADTPVFYIVASNPYGDTFKPIRMTGQHLTATLTGDGPIAQMYYINGTLVAEDPVGGNTSPNLYHPYVDLTQDGTEECGRSGPLMFVQDTTAAKQKPCVTFGNFTLFSDRMDAKLGAKLVLNSNLTDFYACGNLRDIVYKVSMTDEPADCFTLLELFTLPVV